MKKKSNLENFCKEININKTNKINKKQRGNTNCLFFFVSSGLMTLSLQCLWISGQVHNDSIPKNVMLGYDPASISPSHHGLWIKCRFWIKSDNDTTAQKMSCRTPIRHPGQYSKDILRMMLFQTWTHVSSTTMTSTASTMTKSGESD